MFHLDLPNVYKVLNNGKFEIDETVFGASEGEEDKDESSSSQNDDRRRGSQQPIVVVSIFGSTWNQSVRGSNPRFKRAFQLALDGFGTVSLYNKCGIGGEGKVGTNRIPGQSEQNTQFDDNGIKQSKAYGEFNQGEGESAQSEKVEGAKQSRNLASEGQQIGGTLEGFFNEDESVLFLHIEGLAYDAASCLEACQELRSAISESGFLSAWSTFNSNYCKWLLLLFSLSHVMIMSETGSSLDTSYISLFRALDIVRQDVLSSVGRILSTIDGLPRQWVDHARLCSPRLLFLFEVETENPTKLENISSVMSSSIKERKEMLQSEIYQIFRKCRIITNISANSLFAIPANEDFVYVFDKSAQNLFSSQSLSYTYLTWIGLSVKKVGVKSPAAVPVQAARSSSNTSLPVKMSFRAHQDTLTYNDAITSFRSFLMEHVNIALDKGFDDDYRRVSGSKHFFVRPTLSQWEAAYTKLHEQLFVETTSKRILEGFTNMDKFINVDLEYLEIQCAEMFPKIYATYTRGLPEFYTAQQHQSKLAYAVNVFLNISRGPGVLPWLKKLANKCEKYWKNGRQQCETLSLLGRVCANHIHRVKRHDHLEILPLPELDMELPEMHHSSSARIVSYCNCGKRQGSREEPFTIREANYEFYRKLGKECCDKLESYSFPVFTSSTENNREISLQEMIVILNKKSEPNKLRERSDTPTVANNDLDLALASPELPEVFESELRQEDADELEEDSEESETEVEGIENESIQSSYNPSGSTFASNIREHLKNGMTVSDRDRTLLKRNSSTIEYLPGMLHSKSPTGLLTLFPSWSLICLGPSSIYSHSHGVHQAGFLNGANALLPWDVKVKAQEGVTFVPPPRVLRGRRQQHGRKSLTNKSTPTDEFSVKVFFGYEYECKKGHRFFCDTSAILYGLNYSSVTQKAIAAKVIAQDMPLYIYCPCKENRDNKQVAQLIRVHIVTPKAPVFVTLNPKVLPGPSGTCPTFFTGEDQPIKLTPSTYWILRLPFSYVGEVVYVPPSDLSRYNGKLLKGMLNVVSMNPTETEEWEKQNQMRL